MKITVTNLTTGEVSLSTGIILSKSESSSFSLADEAYCAVESGQLDGLSKEARRDADIWIAIKALQTKGVVSTAALGFRSKQLLQKVACSYRGMAFPDIFTGHLSFLPMFCATSGSGRISKAGLYLAQVGADADDPFEVELDVYTTDTVFSNPVSIFTTRPKITKAATPGPTGTLIAGTGIRCGVIDEAANSFEYGEGVLASVLITRTTPQSEMAGAVIFIEIDLPLITTGVVD